MRSSFPSPTLLSPPKELGKWGEETAAFFLQKNGYKILERNVEFFAGKRKIGEIDLVAQKNNKIIFVEVKTIQQSLAFYPEDKMHSRKIKKLIKLSDYYLKQKKISFNVERQIDVVAIEKTDSQPIIRHYANIATDKI